MSSDDESKQADSTKKKPPAGPPGGQGGPPGATKQNNFKLLVDIPAFRWFWISLSINSIGGRFHLLAMLLAASALSGGSVKVVAWISAATALPTLLVSFFGGPIVDRVNHRRLVILCNIVAGVLMLCCALVLHWKSLELFFLFIVLTGLVMGLAGPATGALTPQIVPREKLFGANALNSTSNTVALLAGPFLAGIVISRWGSAAAFAGDGITYIIAAFFLWLIPKMDSNPGGPAGSSYWQQLRVGFRHIWTTPILRNNLFMVVIAIYFVIGASMAIYVPYLQKAFNVSASKIGLVHSAFGVGMLVSGLTTGLGWFNRFSVITNGVISAVLYASASFIRAAATNYFHFMAGNFFGGLSMIIGSAAFGTIVQQNCPMKMLGRVGGVITTLNNTSNMAGMALVPFLMKLTGLRGVYIFGGCLVMFGTLAYLSTLIRKTPEQPQA